ncbi:hypothetical protein [Pseudonocardia sp.]|jgi:hypothetical protein|uniref:hypothetical protein n=1 Tax=Pseudonocardia sp. TaxID=60912 RepID=UPI0025D3F2FB|nr:hypothetical protein [Pseudonocardia sp.]
MGAAAPVPSAAPAALTAQAALLPSVVPVAPEPEVLGATRLVAAVQRVEKQVAAAKAEADRRAAEAKAEAERKAALDCGLDTSGLGAVTAVARAAAQYLGCQYGEPTMYGVAGRAGTSDHPGGRAVDFMVDRSTGDALAACALRNADELGISYVIWRQRINYGSGWEAMEDRGGATANHMDHVHISFGSGSAGAPPPAC